MQRNKNRTNQKAWSPHSLTTTRIWVTSETCLRKTIYLNEFIVMPGCVRCYSRGTENTGNRMKLESHLLKLPFQKKKKNQGSYKNSKMNFFLLYPKYILKYINIAKSYFLSSWPLLFPLPTRIQFTIWKRTYIIEVGKHIEFHLHSRTSL